MKTKRISVFEVLWHACACLVEHSWLFLTDWLSPSRCLVTHWRCVRDTDRTTHAPVRDMSPGAPCVCGGHFEEILPKV